MYGTRLKSHKFYRDIFLAVEKKIIRKYHAAKVSHVGGTSLKLPSGKGDVDVYVLYNSSQERNRLRIILTKLFGVPAKITKDRIRYNFYTKGVEVELQLVNQKQYDAAINLSEYLNQYPSESKKYAASVNKLRQKFLQDMYYIKSNFVRRAKNHE